MTTLDAAASGLPPVFSGWRRGRLGLLAGMGLAQAACSVFAAVATPLVLTGRGSLVGLSAGMAAVSLVVGALRVAERVVAEDLGQHYVGEIRRLLVTAALGPGNTTSLGVTVARTTNDLTAVRNWLVLGIVPLVVGVPLLAGVGVALMVISPTLAAVVGALLGLFAALMFGLARPAYVRSRAVRKVRGQMASHIADTVAAASAIRVAGGVHRELGHVDKFSEKVARAAHQRALVTGAMRGSAASITAIISVLVAVAGSALGVTAADITSGILVAGMLAAPINDLGRVNEARQSQRAAVAVLEPVLARAYGFDEAERGRRRLAQQRPARSAPPGAARGVVHLADMTDRLGTLPELVAHPGVPVRLVGDNHHRIERVLGQLTGDVTDEDAWLQVAGHPLVELPATSRRALVGVASANAGLGRGTVARLVRYRVPDADVDVRALLARVGLDAAVAALPDGGRTKLRAGGRPLTPDQRARLQIAQAIAGDPPLLVLDHVDAHLAPDGRRMLRDLIAGYPGCVIVRAHDTSDLLGRVQVWDLGVPDHDDTQSGPNGPDDEDEGEDG